VCFDNKSSLHGLPARELPAQQPRRDTNCIPDTSRQLGSQQGLLEVEGHAEIKHGTTCHHQDRRLRMRHILMSILVQTCHCHTTRTNPDSPRYSPAVSTKGPDQVSRTGPRLHRNRQDAPGRSGNHSGRRPPMLPRGR
jgi:hypothetical protein